VRNAADGWGAFRPEARQVHRRRANQVLASSVDLLRRICDDDLLNAIAGGIQHHQAAADGGRGLAGVVAKADGYFNPAGEILDGAPAETLARAGQNGGAR
jgi:beta-lysine 5,6-aminomutase alpha subunit